MSISRNNSPSDARSLGFSLVEILVVVALLAVIILGLVAMFNQTRRAFTTSITQVDVLESGRATADLISREMEQLTAAGSANVTNFYVDAQNGYTPVISQLLDPADFRTNFIQEVCFITRNNQTWNAVGYKVLPYSSGMGTLYRYSANNISVTNLTFLSTNVLNFLSVNTPGTNLTRIMDGVIDFRIRAFDTNGILYYGTNNPPLVANATILIQTNTVSADYNATFRNNALPGYVELELGVVEDRTLARYQALTNSSPQAGLNYLINHPGQVHIFRQRIPIRNVNSAAYQ